MNGILKIALGIGAIILVAFAASKGDERTFFKGDDNDKSDDWWVIYNQGKYDAER